MDHPFAAGGPTYLIGVTATQILPVAGQSYRIVNLLATVHYIAWGPTNAVTVAAPTAGNPQANTLALGPNAERTITMPNPGSFWIADIAAAFAVTPGDGV